MSLPHFDTQGTLFGSIGMMAGELFGGADRYRLFAQKIWPVLAKTRAELAQCYCAENGRAGIEPVLLLGVLVFQFMERVPDRAAVEMVKYHLGWKLALNVALQDRGFHATTLVSFRERLLAHGQGGLAFAAVLHALVEEGFVPKKGKQRLDSTHVLGVVARMSSLECVRETLRLALEELERQLPADKRPVWWPQLWERYVENKLDYRSHEPVLRQKHRQAGADSLQLLEWLGASPEELRRGKQVKLLQQVFEQYYEVRAEEVEPVKVHAGGAIKNPHEPEAHWSVKGRPSDRKEWIGYKVQVAESIGAAPSCEGQPPSHFITSMVTQGATESEDAGLVATMAELSAAGLEAPKQMYVDAGYVSAAVLADAKKEGRELIGPARSTGGSGKGFQSEAFDVQVEQRQATCLANKLSTQCSRLQEKKSGKVSYRFEWSTHCHGCELRDRCIGNGLRHRTLIVGEHHTGLQQRRREQTTEAFKKRMHQRNGIEGTHSELIRGHGLRQARYRGKKKLALQNNFIGAACNIKRWLRLMQWQMSHDASVG